MAVTASIGYPLPVLLTPPAGKILWYKLAGTPAFTSSDASVSMDAKGVLSVRAPIPPVTGPTTITMTVKDKAGNLLVLNKIIIRQEGTVLSDPQGALNFSLSQPSPTQMVLTDMLALAGTYEFDLLFTDTAGNQGLLDPRITNM